MHIGMVHLTAGTAAPPGSKFPPDIRVEKEMRALERAGMRISILCPRVSEDELGDEVISPQITIHRRKVASQSRLRNCIENWTMVRSAWVPVISEFVRQNDIDALHVHDLAMIPTTLSVASIHGIPVVADLHENLPAAIQAWHNKRDRWARLSSSLRGINKPMFRWHELRCARACDKIVIVVPEAAERFVDAGISQEKLVLVSNTEDETTFPMPLPAVAPTLQNRYADRWIALYTGSVAPHRGIDTVIRGVAAIAAEIPSFLVLLVGVSLSQRSQIAELVKRNNVAKQIEMLGWVPFDDCLQYQLISKVGLVPHVDSEHTQTTVPHKLFQYMMSKLPVVASNCRPLARIVNAANAGMIFKAGDPDDFSRVMIQLARNEAQRVQLGKNGYRAARDELSWKHDAARLAEMYFDLAKARNKRFRAPEIDCEPLAIHRLAQSSRSHVTIDT